MPRLYEPAEGKAPFIVQVRAEARRASYGAGSLAEALGLIDRLQLTSEEAVVLSAAHGLMSIEEFRRLAAQSGQSAPVR